MCPYVLAPVARFSGKWNIPLLTTGGQASTFRQKKQYPLLTTIGGSYEQFAVFFVKLLQRYQWEVVTFLYQTYPQDSGKGSSTCQFMLGNVYQQWFALMKENDREKYVTHESLEEEFLNKTEIESLLKRVQSKARGKKL